MLSLRHLGNLGRYRDERFLLGPLFIYAALLCLWQPNSIVRADEPVELPVYQYRYALIREWKLLGPFPRDFDIGYDEVAESLKTGEPVECEGRQFEWYSKRWDNGVGQLGGECRAVDLPADNVKFYAACWLRPSTTESRRYYFGADDGATYWINGKEIFDSRGPAWHLWNADSRKLELEADQRHLCIIEARNQGGGYAFSVACSRERNGRVTYLNGTAPLQGVEVSALNEEGTLLEAVTSDENGVFRFKRIPYDAEVQYECPTGMLRKQTVTLEDGSERIEIQTREPIQYVQEEILPLGRVPKRPVTAMCPLPDGRVVFALEHENDIYVLSGDRVNVLFKIDEGPKPNVEQILATEQLDLIVRVHDRLFGATLSEDGTYEVSKLALPSTFALPPKTIVECMTLDNSGNLWCCTTSPDDVKKFLADRNASDNKGKYHLHKFEKAPEYSRDEDPEYSLVKELKHSLVKELPFRCIDMLVDNGTVVGAGRYGATVRFTPEAGTPEEGSMEQAYGPTGQYAIQLIRSASGRLALIESAAVAIQEPGEKWRITITDERTYSAANRGVFVGDELFFFYRDKLLLHQGRTFRKLLSSERMHSLIAANGSLLCGLSNGTIIRVNKAPYRKFGIKYGTAFQAISRVVKDEQHLRVFSSDNQASAELSTDGRVVQELGMSGVPIFLPNGVRVYFATHFHYRRRMMSMSPQIIVTKPKGDVRELETLEPDWGVNETILNTLVLRNGRVLIGTVARMHVFDSESSTVTPIEGTELFAQMATEGASAFLQSSASEIYIGTLRGGLFKVDLQNGSAEELCRIEGEEPFITALHEVSPTDLLVGSTIGAFRVNLESGAAEHFSPDVIGKPKIQEFLPAPGRLYIATLDAGVFSMHGDVVVPIVGIPDLRNAEIADVHLGPENELVVGTTEGVVEYYPATHPPRIWTTSLEVNGARSDLDAQLKFEEGSSVNLGVVSGQPKRIAALRYRIAEGPWVQLKAGDMNVRHNLEGTGIHDIEVQAIDRDHNFSEIARVSIHSYLPLHRWALVRWSAGILTIGLVGLLIGSSVKMIRAQNRLIDTERRAREAAEENVAERERLLQRVSHDLRNPLFVVAGCAEMIEHGQMEAKAALPILNETVDSMTYLSRQLLSYSKAKAGRHTDEHGYTDVGRLLQKLRDEAYITNREQRVDLRLEIAPDAHMHLAISSQILKEILHNLLNNSIKCTSVGEIAIHYSTDGGQPKFCVQDTGCGMDQETLDYIFKPFFKQTARRPGTGFGLGLSICKALADEIGAELDVESEIDKGTRVSLELPTGSITQPDQIPEEAREQEATGALGTKGDFQQAPEVRRRVDLGEVDGLLVDDLRFVRDVLVKRLSAIGVSVYDCNSTSIPDLSKFQPKFVLTDLEMPVSSGFDIAQRIKEATPSVVVIAISERQDLLQEAKESDYFDMVLTKVSLLTNTPDTLRLFQKFAGNASPSGLSDRRPHHQVS